MQSLIFEQAPSALLLVDPYNDCIRKANVAACDLFNIETSQLHQIKVSALFKACLPMLHAFSEAIMVQGQAVSSELYIQSKQNPLYLDIKAKYLEPYILFSCEDSRSNFKYRAQAIAQSNYQAGLLNWKQNESVFDEIERHNQLLLSAVGDGIYGVDANGCTTFVNQAAEQILGWMKSEITGKKIHNIIHHSHETGAHYHARHCPIYASFRDGKVHFVDDEVFWHKSGSAIPVEYTSTPVTDNGELVGAVVVFRDITERKKNQQKLLSALDEIASLKQKLEAENAYLLEELNADFNHHQIIGQSAVLQRLVQQIELVGPTAANVLVIGESGTGKELIARALHEISDRKSRPLIKVNCAAIPTELFESEFFGHIKGAFSGAIAERVGRFELADGGTIFLDEIGEIPLQLQSKLLRVLQEQQFERVGDSKTRNVDVRVIAATNRDLKQLVAENKFREDLYFRLNVFPIDSPPLRERLDDIPVLLAHFINKVCSRLNQPKPSISKAQMQHLQSYRWPGNIRELENIIERQVILAKGGKLDFSFLVDKPEQVNSSQISAVKPDELMTNNQYQTLEIANIEKALKQSKGKIYGDNGAAELLGLKPTTLASKIKKYRIDKKALVSS